MPDASLGRSLPSLLLPLMAALSYTFLLSRPSLTFHGIHMRLLKARHLLDTRSFVHWLDTRRALNHGGFNARKEVRVQPQNFRDFPQIKGFGDSKVARPPAVFAAAMIIPVALPRDFKRTRAAARDFSGRLLHVCPALRRKRASREWKVRIRKMAEWPPSRSRSVSNGYREIAHSE